LGSFKDDELGVEMTIATLLSMGVSQTFLTDDILSQMPPWSQVMSNFGTEPVILGSERCKVFRDAVPPEDRQIAPAGMLFTGTNVLHQHLLENCPSGLYNQRFQILATMLKQNKKTSSDQSIGSCIGNPNHQIFP
jgi:hypothetical protein